MTADTPPTPDRRSPAPMRVGALLVALAFIASSWPGHAWRAPDLDEMLDLRLADRPFVQLLLEPYDPGPRAPVELLSLHAWRVLAPEDLDPRLLSALLLAGVVALVFRLGRRWFGTPAALAAALLLTALPPCFDATTRIGPTLWPALVAMALLAVIDAAAGGRRAPLAALPPIALVGCLAHPFGVVALLAPTTSAALELGSRSRRPARDGLVAVGAVALGCALAALYGVAMQARPLAPPASTWLPHDGLAQALIGWWIETPAAERDPAGPASLLAVTLAAAAGLGAAGPARRRALALLAGPLALPLLAAALLGGTIPADVTPELAALAMPALALLAGRGLAAPSRARGASSAVQLVGTGALAAIIALPLVGEQLEARWRDPGPPTVEASRLLARVTRPGDTVVLAGWASAMLPPALESRSGVARPFEGVRLARVPSMAPAPGEPCDLYLRHRVRASRLADDARPAVLVHADAPQLCPPDLTARDLPISERSELDQVLAEPGRKWIATLSSPRLPAGNLDPWVRSLHELEQIPGRHTELRRGAWSFRLRRLDERLLSGHARLAPLATTPDESWRLRAMEPLELVARPLGPGPPPSLGGEATLIVDGMRAASPFSDPAGGGWRLHAAGPLRLWMPDRERGIELFPVLDTTRRVPVAFLPGSTARLWLHVERARELTLELGLAGVPFATTLELTDRATGRTRLLSVAAGAVAWQTVAGDGLRLDAGTHELGLALGADSVDRYLAAGRAAPVSWVRLSEPSPW